jgi:hypothetical protein
MLTLEKLLTELKVESVNEIVGGKGFLGIHFGRRRRRNKNKSKNQSANSSQAVKSTP